jgi:hypothetical protein
MQILSWHFVNEKHLVLTLPFTDTNFVHSFSFGPSLGIDVDLVFMSDALQLFNLAYFSNKEVPQNTRTTRLSRRLKILLTDTFGYALIW